MRLFILLDLEADLQHPANRTAPNFLENTTSVAIPLRNQLNLSSTKNLKRTHGHIQYRPKARGQFREGTRGETERFTEKQVSKRDK